MPPSRFLYEVQPIRGEKSKLALDLPPGSKFPAGFDPAKQQIVPKQEAIALMEFLVQSRAEPYLFEVPPPFKPKKPAAGTNAPAVTASAPAATNAPAR